MHLFLILLIVVATGSAVAAIGWQEAASGGIARGRIPQTSKQFVLRLSAQVANRIGPTARELGQAIVRLWGMTVRAVSAAALSTAARAREAAAAMGTEVARLRAAHRTRVEERRAREATAGPRPVRARFDRSFLLTAEPALSARDGEVEGRAFRLDALDDHHPVRGMIGLILVIALIGTMLALALGGTAWGVYHLLNART